MGSKHDRADVAADAVENNLTPVHPAGPESLNLLPNTDPFNTAGY